MPVPVIDLFAGPGGLSEGFEGYGNRSQGVFRCVLSIEKERFAHRTLLLRSFFRQFKNPPKEYYAHLRGELSLRELYRIYPKQHDLASREAIRLALGYRNRDRIDNLIQSRLGKDRNGKWVLIGGPPCQAYSLIGRVRIRAESQIKFEKDRRHFLYKEYLRIVKKFRPPVFVMENVKGLLSSSTRGGEVFKRILSDFYAAGYSVHSFVRIVNGGKREQLKPSDFVIESEKFSIPQARHRVFLLGIRKDISRGTTILRKGKTSVPIQAAIGDLPPIRSQVSPPSWDSYERWVKELRRLTSVFRQDGRLRGMRRFKNIHKRLTSGAPFIAQVYPSRARSKWLRRHDRWFIDRRIKGVTLHQGRHHMPTDLRRYLFASHYACKYEVSPKMADFSWWQRPDHENLKNGAKHSPFSDRFRVQIRGRPSTTVVSHISKDGHYYIHYDPTQCRSLTVREVARLQTFPDNYFFCGPRTAQYTQVGNAVPPLLARQVAKIVFGILKGDGDL